MYIGSRHLSICLVDNVYHIYDSSNKTHIQHSRTYPYPYSISINTTHLNREASLKVNMFSLWLLPFNDYDCKWHTEHRAPST